MSVQPPVWDAERDADLVCVAVRVETHDVSTFVFAPAQPRLFQFLPGQYMTFELEAAGVQRSYTIASPPTRPQRIEITVKRADTGPGSRWLHGSMRAGARVRASGPAGDFSCGMAPPGKLLLLSAGSGITPLMSMARTLHDLGADTDILFIHSARSPDDLVFADELRVLARRPGFRSVGVVERDVPGARWDGYRGRLSPAMLGLLAPDLLQREVYCCGPAPYMAAVRAMLDEAGADRSRYHEESFSFEEERGPEPAAVIGTGGFTVRFARLGRDISCAPGTTVLAAARAAGVRLPSACGKGVCGTCKSRVLSGTVEMRHGGGIRQREIDGGMALLCCARPSSDLVVDR